MKLEENINNKALKSGIWYTISAISVKTITIITTPIFARMMSKSDYGMSATFLSWCTLLAVICSLNLTYSTGRAKQDFPGQLEKYIGSMQLLSLSFTLALSLLAIVFIDIVSGFMEMPKQLVFILIMYLLSFPMVSLAQNRFRFEYRYKENIVITVFNTIGNVLITLLLLLMLDNNKYYAKVWGYVLPITTLAFIFGIIGIKKKSFGFNKEYMMYGLSLSVPLIVHTISLNILSQSDRIFITKYCGSDYTGLYSLAYQYAILISIVSTTINEGWLPWFQDKYYLGAYDEIMKNVKPLIMLGCFIGVGCIAVGPEAILILGGKTYLPAQWVVPPATIGVVCQFIYTRYVHIELQLKKTKIISACTLTAALLNIVLNYIFIPKYGFIAAAYTTLASYFVLFLIHFYVTKKVLNVNLYDDKFMFLSILVCAVLSVIFALLYSQIILRYILIVVISCIYLYTNRDYVLSIISNIIKKNKK